MWWIAIVFLPVLQASQIKYTMYSNSSKLLPKPMTERDKIQFFLHLRDGNSQELKINDSDALLRSGFNFNESTKVIIHGWISSNNTALGLSKLRNAYLQNTTNNIISVDWTRLATGQYKTAKENSETVFKVFLKFVRFLVSAEVNIKQLHLLGHCVGAHVAGRVGKYFRERENALLDAITGLDPAYPGYKFCSEDLYLSKYDARYVEVVHTSLGYWGFRGRLGQVDFYPNGGKNQPGCMDDKTGLCCHDRAVWYYAYSITNEMAFRGVKVVFLEDGNYHYGRKYVITMSGVNLNYGREGMYFLRTESDEPFIFQATNDPKYPEMTDRPLSLIK